MTARHFEEIQFSSSSPPSFLSAAPSLAYLRPAAGVHFVEGKLSSSPAVNTRLKCRPFSDLCYSLSTPALPSIHLLCCLKTPADPFTHYYTHAPSSTHLLHRVHTASAFPFSTSAPSSQLLSQLHTFTHLFPSLHTSFPFSKPASLSNTSAPPSATLRYTAISITVDLLSSFLAFVLGFNRTRLKLPHYRRLLNFSGPRQILLVLGVNCSIRKSAQIVTDILRRRRSRSHQKIEETMSSKFSTIL